MLIFYNHFYSLHSYENKYYLLVLPSCFQQYIYIDHFNSLDHKGFLEDVSITFIDKTDPSDPEKREGYWIQTLKAAAPWFKYYVNGLCIANLCRAIY